MKQHKTSDAISQSHLDTQGVGVSSEHGKYTLEELNALPAHEISGMAAYLNEGQPITDYEFTLLYQTLPNIDTSKWSNSEFFSNCKLGLYDSERKLIKSFGFPKGTAKERAIQTVFILANQS